MCDEPLEGFVDVVFVLGGDGVATHFPPLDGVQIPVEGKKKEKEDLRKKEKKGKISSLLKFLKRNKRKREKREKRK